MLIVGVVPNDAERVEPPVITLPILTYLHTKGVALVELPASSVLPV